MQIKDLKQGMWIECQQGVAKIISIDQAHNSVIIENRDDHTRNTIKCDDITDQPQLHTGCDSYY
ncbi:MAG: hypothetical protein V7735_14465 [Photobacterium frigidiphilum]|uniref:hypothetical protein n=1 Tax=Photobacterium frigidiphilum TaxID=264736 RepID=UPI0030023799